MFNEPWGGGSIQWGVVVGKRARRSTSFWISHRLGESRRYPVFCYPSFKKILFLYTQEMTTLGASECLLLYFGREKMTRCINRPWDVKIKSGSEQVVAPTDTQKGALPFLGHWNKFTFCTAHIQQWKCLMIAMLVMLPMMQWWINFYLVLLSKFQKCRRLYLFIYQVRYLSIFFYYRIIEAFVKIRKVTFTSFGKQKNMQFRMIGYWSMILQIKDDS